MKTYPNGATLAIPYLVQNEDGTTDRAWGMMRFGPCCKRAIKKELRRFVRNEMQRSLAPDEQHHLMKRIKAL